MSSDVQVLPSSGQPCACAAVSIVAGDLPPTQSSDSPSLSGSAKEPLWSVYDNASAYVYTDRRRAREILDQAFSQGLERFAGPPDLWHNTAMVAAQCNHRDAEIGLIEAGLREWPDNIDLLCDELQLRYSSHYNLACAKEIWQRLVALPKSSTGPYWRFWVYGAIYHGTILFDRAAALDLLDAGLRRVSPDYQMEILRCYRRILVDSPPSEELEDEDAFIKRQQVDLTMLENRYKLGIQLTVENGHVLALELARLCIQRVGADIMEWDAETIADAAFARREHYLQAASYYLDLSELTYNGDVNHPIWETYKVRINLLMAQRKYVEALDLLRSLPPSELQDPSTIVMLKLAARKAGEPLNESESSEQPIPDSSMLEKSLQLLLTNNGELLVSLARENPIVSKILNEAVQKLK
jgi:hypothetical protein